MNLPRAPKEYDQRDQDELRRLIEDALTKYEQSATNWVAWTGTASRATVNADAPPTNLQLGQAFKAMLDDLVLRVKS
jgi:hypothetical protein